MSQRARGGLGAVCFGLLIMGFGLIWAADLFGVATEHARLTRDNRFNRAFLWPKQAPQMSRMVRSARLTGAATMLFGAATVVAGVVNFFAGRD